MRKEIQRKDSVVVMHDEHAVGHLCIEAGGAAIQLAPREVPQLKAAIYQMEQEGEPLANQHDLKLVANGVALLEVRKNGDVYIRGELVANAVIYEELTKWMAEAQAHFESFDAPAVPPPPAAPDVPVGPDWPAAPEAPDAEPVA